MHDSHLIGRYWVSRDCVRRMMHRFTISNNWNMRTHHVNRHSTAGAVLIDTWLVQNFCVPGCSSERQLGTTYWVFILSSYADWPVSEGHCCPCDVMSSLTGSSSSLHPLTDLCPRDTAALVTWRHHSLGLHPLFIHWLTCVRGTLLPSLMWYDVSLRPAVSFNGWTTRFTRHHKCQEDNFEQQPQNILCPSFLDSPGKTGNWCEMVQPRWHR